MKGVCIFVLFVVLDEEAKRYSKTHVPHMEGIPQIDHPRSEVHSMKRSEKQKSLMVSAFLEGQNDLLLIILIN